MSDDVIGVHVLRSGGRRLEPVAGSRLHRAGQKKLLYTAVQVQPDADQLVLVSTGNGKVLLDIPEPSTSEN